MNRLSQRGVAFIKAWEGCKLLAYQDGKGVWTVGWGATGPNICRGVRWTQAQADAAFLRHTGGVEQAINQLVRVPLTQGQFDALCAFVYNIGAANFQQSTMLRRLNALDYHSASREFPRWNKITLPDGRLVVDKGLTNRRAAEAVLFTVTEE